MGFDPIPQAVPVDHNATVSIPIAPIALGDKWHSPGVHFYLLRLATPDEGKVLVSVPVDAVFVPLPFRQGRTVAMMGGAVEVSIDRIEHLHERPEFPPSPGGVPACSILHEDSVASSLRSGHPQSFVEQRLRETAGASTSLECRFRQANLLAADAIAAVAPILARQVMVLPDRCQVSLVSDLVLPPSWYRLDYESAGPHAIRGRARGCWTRQQATTFIKRALQTKLLDKGHVGHQRPKLKVDFSVDGRVIVVVDQPNEAGRDLRHAVCAFDAALGIKGQAPLSPEHWDSLPSLKKLLVQQRRERVGGP